jgi:5-methyltetrahydrofolate--homocysteine methyltransferase
VATFLPYDEVEILGLNCAFGPYELTETMRQIAENWPRFVSALPNAACR